ncbi:MAG: AAA family ATPase [Kiritimatiellia bacterium]|jgi:DNA transposition AAA+ family ATPase
MRNEEKTIQGEIAELAGRLGDYAARKGWSIARLCRECPGLGSDRTFRDMAAGNLDGYDAEAQLANLRSAWAVAEETAGDGAAEPVYDDLSVVQALRRACLAAMKSWGSNRVVIVQGASGVGKTTALRIVAGRYGDRIAACEASEVWNDKPAAMLGAMLRALGHDGNLPHGAMARLEEAQRRLSVARKCVVVDEAHHMGPRCLNAVKTLVNTTPGEFVLIAIPTLWAKLESAAYQEARQLSTNRLSERVRLALCERDIAAYLAHAVPEMAVDGKLARSAAKLIRPAAEAAGNLAFVRDVARLLPATGPVGLEEVAEAVKAAAARR